MKILAIDSSAKAASVAIVEDGKILGEVFLNCGLTHSVTVMPSVEWLLDVTGLKIYDVERIAITEGPGSFTGLRIGMAAVKGLAWACDIPCVGVSTLETIALGASVSDGIVCAVMDARANQVYNALFEAKDGKLSRLTEDRAITIPELLEEISEMEKVSFAGDGAELCYQRAERKFNIVPENVRCQRASAVAFIASEKESVSAQELSPEYIRLPQAERERLERIKNK